MTSISNRMTGITDSRSSNSMTGISDSRSSNSMSNSRSMSISVSNWCSNSGSSNSRSMSISNWCSNSMNSWLVDSDMVLVDHRGFYNMLDWVDFVGFGYSIGLGYFNSVRFCNMFFNCKKYDIDLVFRKHDILINFFLPMTSLSTGTGTATGTSTSYLLTWISGSILVT